VECREGLQGGLESLTKSKFGGDDLPPADIVELSSFHYICACEIVLVMVKESWDQRL